MKGWNSFLLGCAAVFAVLSILAIMTGSAPAIFQMVGSCIVCVWGAWFLRDRRSQGKEGR